MLMSEHLNLKHREKTWWREALQFHHSLSVFPIYFFIFTDVLLFLVLPDWDCVYPVHSLCLCVYTQGAEGRRELSGLPQEEVQCTLDKLTLLPRPLFLGAPLTLLSPVPPLRCPYLRASGWQAVVSPPGHTQPAARHHTVPPHTEAHVSWAAGWMWEVVVTHKRSHMRHLPPLHYSPLNW